MNFRTIGRGVAKGLPGSAGTFYPSYHKYNITSISGVSISGRGESVIRGGIGDNVCRFPYKYTTNWGMGAGGPDRLWIMDFEMDWNGLPKSIWIFHGLWISYGMDMDLVSNPSGPTEWGKLKTGNTSTQLNFTSIGGAILEENIWKNSELA